MSNNFRMFLNLSKRISRGKALYENIKADPELKEVSGKFGGRAIKYSIAAIVIGCLAFVVQPLLGLMKDNFVMVIFGAVALAVIAALMLYGIGFIVASFVCAVRQRKLNKKPIGIIGLIFACLSVVAYPAVIILAFVGI